MMSSDPATSTASAENELSVGVDAAAPTIPVLPVAEQERMVQTNDQESLANCDTPLEAASPSSSAITEHGENCGCSICLPSVFPYPEVSSDLVPPPDSSLACVETVLQHSPTDLTQPEPTNEVETDSCRPPPPKRPRLSKPTKVQLKTHDNKSLEKFVLYLPPEFPAEMVQVIEEFVYSSLRLYSSLWKLAKTLKVVDLRFQLPYSIHLKEKGIATLLSLLPFRGTTIEKFLLPCVKLHTSNQLEVVLKPLTKFNNKTNNNRIIQLFLPLECLLTENDVDNLNYVQIINTLCKIDPKNLCLISRPADFNIMERLESNFKVKLAQKNSSITIVVVSPDADELTGLSFLSSLKSQSKTPSETRPVNPTMLFESLNMSTEVEERSEEIGIDEDDIETESDEETFTTDLTYLESSKLSCTRLYPSKFWNLASLHDHGTNGTGANIAIIDSGINYMHATFKGRIIAIKNFVPSEDSDQDCVIDTNGHGTYCAGIAIGQLFDSPQGKSSICIPSGVAPGAHLIVCKVADTAGKFRYKAFINALKWLKSEHMSTSEQHIDVVSISLGISKYSKECSQAISELTSLGIIVVCAASNNGRLRLQPVTFPARLGHVLCIGAHDENGKPTSLSPVGREMDFLAPGQDVWGPGPGTKSPFAMDCCSGTSCAAPAVAGLVCLVLQTITRIYESDQDKFCIGKRPLKEVVRSVWVMRELLKEMSSSPGHHSEEIGYGTLNPHRLLDRSPDELLRVIREFVHVLD